MKRTLLKLLIFGLFLAGIALLTYEPKINPETLAQELIKKKLEQRFQISNLISDSIKKLEFPNEINRIDNPLSSTSPLKITYTIDPLLQDEAQKLLRTYKPDYGAIFLMDANNGRVLAMTSYEKNAQTVQNLTLKAGYPAASVFKIVTATTAVDRAGLEPGHSIQFNGSNYTLYKKNVLSDKTTKWTRSITLKEAFARSINTAFGRLSLKNFHPIDLQEYADRFSFNQEIPTDFEIEKSTANVPKEKGFEFTEAASGFNKINRMSPVHGAMIAASVANDGVMVVPYLVDSIHDSKNIELYHGEVLEKGQIMSSSSAEKMRELMEQTVKSGTSSKSFRPLTRNKKYDEVEVGGKTGHLTGDNPKGRVDWFVGYAFDANQKIAIAALTVNVQYWTVKSSHLAQSLFKKYFEPQIRPQANFGTNSGRE